MLESVDQMMDEQRVKWILEFDLPRVQRLNKKIPLKKNTDKISQWAPKNRTLPPGTPFEGKWQNSKTPYMVEIADELSPSSSTEVITVMKMVQGGATAGSAENKIGFSIDVDPQPILYVTATEDLATEWSEQRLGPMLELCGLDKKLGGSSTAKGTRSTGNKVHSKTFPGGHILICSYNQVNMLRSLSFQVVIFDEVDTAPVSVKSDGDPRKVGEARTTAYEYRKKILIISTPLDILTSRVYQAFLEGDQRYYHVPCPHCKLMITMELLDENYNCNLEYEFSNEAKTIVDEKTVFYPCPECGADIRNHHKTGMYDSGDCFWKPTNEADAMPRNKSYNINALYCPPGMISFATLAQQFVNAEGDDDKMRTYVNLRGAKPYESKGENVTNEQVLSKKAGYERGSVPDGMLMTTCAGDLHKDRLDVEILGFDGFEEYSIEWKHYFGNPTCERGGSLYKFMKDFQDGKLPGNPRIGFVDAAYGSSEVYKMASMVDNLYAVRGEDWIAGGVPFTESTLKKYNGMKYIRVNTGLIKSQIMNQLKLEPYEDGEFPNGYPHFPNDYEDAYFDQLNSESKIAIIDKNTKKVKGFKWMPTHNKGNHALDCRVYAKCACQYWIYLMACDLKIDELGDYSDIVWSCLRDPSKVDMVLQMTS